jgi:4-oxalocrotonate tautomerase
MPVVHVSFFPGRTVEQKRELVQDITDAFTKLDGIEPPDVWVLIDEVPRENFGVAGKLQSEAQRT